MTIRVRTIRSLSIALLVALAATLPTQAESRSTIVLLHGAFETASVWAPVEKNLRAKGYKVIAVNLPGRPGNPLDPKKATLDLYRDAVLKALKREKKPVVLVGHSFGGITISNVGEAAPKKIKSLVYLAAYLPQNGESLLALSGKDKDGQLGPHFKVSEDKTTAYVEPAFAGDLFCNECTPQAKTEVEKGMVPEPLAPPATPVTLTAANFGKVDKVYIHTAKDRVVSPYLQKLMVDATPVRKQLSLDTGHAPFAADPTALTEAIIEAAK